MSLPTRYSRDLVTYSARIVTPLVRQRAGFDRLRLRAFNGFDVFLRELEFGPQRGNSLSVSVASTDFRTASSNGTGSGQTNITASPIVLMNRTGGTATWRDHVS